MRVTRLGPGPGLIVLLGALEAFGPLSMDLYMPALPELARSLDTNDALAQATMSVCMIGLALGQLIAGPLSDRHGRRAPMLVGIALFSIFSLASALAPDVWWLLAFRFFQGLGGSAGMVISLAIARDLYSGAALSKMISWLSLVGASAPIIAPVIGGFLTAFMDWRGFFFILTSIGVALLATALLLLPETLDPVKRTTRNGRSFAADARVLLGPGFYRVLLAISAVSGIAFFSYLSMASFVLQQEFSFSPMAFGLAFAAGSICNVIGSQTSRVPVTRFGIPGLYSTGLVAGFFAGVLVLVSSLLGFGVPAVLTGLWLYLASTGFTLPNSNALALTEHGDRAGSAAALLGTTSLVTGPIAAPIISLAGIGSLTLGLTLTIALGVCVALWFTAGRRA